MAEWTLRADGDEHGGKAVVVLTEAEARAVLEYLDWLRVAPPTRALKYQRARCPAMWASFNRCVRPAEHPEQHLTAGGFSWSDAPKSGG